jgi:multidrug efflux pump
VASDLQDKGLQVYLVIDRDAAAPGVSVSNITDALYDAFGQRQISTIYTQASQYRVVLQAQSGEDRPQALDQIHVKTTDGGQVRLSAWRIEERQAQLAITHIGQFPAVMMSFNLAPGVALGRRCRSNRCRRTSACRLACRPSSRARPRRSRRRCRAPCC